MVSWRYKVFLSFRGEDTRNKFVGHLYKELCNKGIYAFKDDQKIKRGESIKPVIFDAIQDSRSSLVVLSEDYASSTWCLDELVKIMRCMDEFQQIVVPIFYDVAPSDVSDVKGKFKQALDKHEANFAQTFSKDEEKYEEAMERLQQWKKALTQVAYLSGWDSRHSHMNDAALIKHIVGDISNKLSCELSSDATNLVGMSSHVRKMDQLLEVEKKVVRMVGIWGIDGIGKTKIARVIYDKFFSQFHAGCFLDNVRDKFRKHGASALIKELISKTLLESDLEIWPLDRDSNVIKDRLGRKKVLLVIDDVDDLEQLEVLVKPDWFCLGSRIIITTNDKQLLVAHGVKVVYQVPYLDHDQALQLFCQYAFKQNQPKEGYLELSNSFVSYINGLPLALKVLGSFLYEKSPHIWQSELDKLGMCSNKKIQELLEIGYYGLEDTEKHAFLDIACFFNGENEDFVHSILDGCGFFADRTLRVLKDKAMITIRDNKVFMHELLQEMGREIVRKESKEYGEQSRLWNAGDVDFILTNPKETEKVEGIFLDTSQIDEIQIHPRAFTGLRKLRLLKLYNSFAQKCNVQLEGLSSISELLRFLNWPTYPLKSLPLRFCPKYLVELNLPYSNVQQLWLGKQPLVNLISIDLNHSNVTELPDLSEAQKLKRLNLEGCKNLVHASFIEHLSTVQYLNFKDCEKLRNLPSMIKLTFLRTLDLSNCSSLEEIFQLPENIEYIFLIYCTSLVNLPQEIFSLKSLKNLDIAGCLCFLRTRLSTGTKMDIPNEQEKEKREGEIRRIESVGSEIQKSSGDFSNKSSEGQVDMSAEPIIECSEFQSYHESQSTAALYESIQASQTDIYDVSIAENTMCNADLGIYCADTASPQVGSVHAIDSSSSVYDVGRDLSSIANNDEPTFDSSFCQGKSCHNLDDSSFRTTANLVTWSSKPIESVSLRVTEAVLHKDSMHRAKDIIRVVGKENTDEKVSSIETSSIPIFCPQRDMNLKPIAETVTVVSKSTQAKSKRASTMKTPISSKKRRLEDEISQSPKPSILSTKVTATTYKRSSTIKLAAFIKKRSKLGYVLSSKNNVVVGEIEDDNSTKTGNTSVGLEEVHRVADSEEGKEKEGSENPSEFGFSESTVLDNQCTKETSLSKTQQLVSPSSSDKESATANEETQQAKILSASRSSASMSKPHASIFADLATILGRRVENSVTCTGSYVGVTSSVTINLATRQLKKLLQMELQDLVRMNWLKEAAGLIHTLEKETNLLSEEQRSCILLLKKLELWGNTLKESEEHVAQATRVLAWREEAKQELEKVYDEIIQVSKELNEKSAENKETQNFLAQVHQKIEEAKKKLTGLEDEGKHLSEKVKLQQKDLDKLSGKQDHLYRSTEPLLHHYQSQDEDQIRDDLNTARRKITEVGEAYKQLQASFSSFSSLG